jgi:hypothetical protein
VAGRREDQYARPYEYRQPNETSEDPLDYAKVFRLAYFIAASLPCQWPTAFEDARSSLSRCIRVKAENRLAGIGT